jgi:mannosyltransferase OCH1-like enzyme
MIPKIIHQIWIGNKELPDEEKEWINSWKANNKEFEHVLWTNNNIIKLPEAYELIIKSLENKMALISDIYRYYILFLYGGFYVDTDIINYRSINGLSHYRYVFLRPHKNANHFTNAFFGISKNNKLLINCLNNIKPLNKNQIKNGYAYTGGQILTKAIKEKFNIVNSRDEKTKKINDFLAMNPEDWYKDTKNKESYMYHYARASHIEKINEK